MSKAKNILLYGEAENPKDGENRLDFVLNSMFKLLEEETVFDRKSAEKVFWERIELIHQLEPSAKPD